MVNKKEKQRLDIYMCAVKSVLKINSRRSPVFLSGWCLATNLFTIDPILRKSIIFLLYCDQLKETNKLRGSYRALLQQQNMLWEEKRKIPLSDPICVIQKILYSLTH